MHEIEWTESDERRLREMAEWNEACLAESWAELEADTPPPFYQPRERRHPIEKT
jgi:hypothetical protein